MLVFEAGLTSRIPSDLNGTRGRQQNGFSYALQPLRIPGNAIWALQCPFFFPSNYEHHFWALFVEIHYRLL